MKRYLGALLLGATLLVPGGMAAASSGEAFFSTALNYTVQIRAAVPIPFEEDRKGTRRGAGFVVDAARGWIMTNAHVVSRSPSRVEVAFYGTGFVEAQKVYVDPHLDVAIIQVPRMPDNAVAAPLDCGELPRVGHPVGAFGHPSNLRFTGTRGIISGVTSRFQGEALQTDAPINGGNSGGPLISLETGRIVGINTAQLRGQQNTNFAVAMRYACRVLDLLEQGVDPSPPDLRLAFFRDTDDEKILKVARNYGAAERLPLRNGDIIREVVGVPGRIQNETQLLHALRGRLDGFRLKIERGGSEMIVEGRAEPQPHVVDARGVLAAGLLFAPIPVKDTPEFTDSRFMVHHIERGSEGESKELNKGDILELLDGEPVITMEDLHRRLSRANGVVTLTLKRFGGGDRMFSYLERRIVVTGVEWIAERTPAGALAQRPEPHAAHN
ncbi:MAG: trypsin-like peptidase domain-containing protein [Betaproteobacteria bacterium]|nr:trypsin-like peptidase domain-containing protein [Betaproteobacteria bacterium]